jgi:flagellar basal body-associated protein FliL
MQILEYPYVIITLLGLCFLLLAAVGIYFAVRGAKTAKGRAEKDFVNISKLESAFEKSGKTKAERCVLYGRLDMDNLLS